MWLARNYPMCENAAAGFAIFVLGVVGLSEASSFLAAGGAALGVVGLRPAGGAALGRVAEGLNAGPNAL
jgi:hypothetical protein